MVNKMCIDCGKIFECFGKGVRCRECQELYRKVYQQAHQKRWWVDKPKSSHRYYQFYKFIQSLTDDDIRALVTIKRQKMNEQGADIKELRTYIKILTTEYTKRIGDKNECSSENER